MTIHSFPSEYVEIAIETLAKENIMNTISAASKLAATALFLFTCIACAQEPSVPPPPTVPSPVPVTMPTAETSSAPALKTPAQYGPAGKLSPSLRREIEPGRTITVVTVAEPLLRQACKVESFEAEKLTCALKGSSKKDSATPNTISYTAADLVAVIKTNAEFNRFSPLKLLAKFGFGGGAIAGAAVLAATSMVAAVPLAIVGTIFLLDALFEVSDIDGERQHPRERLIYMNPDQRLPDLTHLKPARHCVRLTRRNASCLSSSRRGDACTGIVFSSTLKSTMHPDTEKLMTLQRYDLEAKRLREEIAALPKLIAQLESKATATVGQRAVVLDLIAKEEVLRRRQESDVRDHQAKIAKIRKQLDNATDTKQVTAFEHEIQFAQSAIAKLEDAELESMERSDGLEAQRKVADAAVAAAQAKYEEERERAVATIVRDKTALADLEATRAEHRKTIGEDALSTYDRIAKSKGTGIAEVLLQKCTACQMMQRPQRWNDLRDRDNNELFSCESCGRLLWYDPARDSPQRKPVETESIAARIVRGL